MERRCLSFVTWFCRVVGSPDIALKYFDCNRAALRGEQQPEHYLSLASLAVTVVAECAGSQVRPSKYDEETS